MWCHPTGQFHWNCCEGATEIFEIPPPSCFGSDDEFSTLHHPFILLPLMLFALITYIAFASAQEHYSAVLWFLKLSFLLPLQGLPASSNSPGSKTNKDLRLPHTIISLCQSFLCQNLRCLFPSDSAPSLSCFVLGWCNNFHPGNKNGPCPASFPSFHSSFQIPVLASNSPSPPTPPPQFKSLTYSLGNILTTSFSSSAHSYIILGSLWQTTLRTLSK